MRVLGLLMACGLYLTAPAAQAQTQDMCALMARNPGWAEAVRSASLTWKVSPGTILTVIDQESRFRANAKGAGAVDANSVRNFGFAQANLRTWNWFLRDTGRDSGSRSNFALSADFIGWHFTKMEARTGIARSQFVSHYLIYKMGEGGFRRGAPQQARSLASTLAVRAKFHDRKLWDCGFGEVEDPDEDGSTTAPN
jgi:hypothetical protein